jgi:hypothetical protein
MSSTEREELNSHLVKPLLSMDEPLTLSHWHQPGLLMSLSMGTLEPPILVLDCLRLCCQLRAPCYSVVSQDRVFAAESRQFPAGLHDGQGIWGQA